MIPIHSQADPATVSGRSAGAPSRGGLRGLALLLAALVLPALPAVADQITLKDNRVIALSNVRVSATAIMTDVTLPGGTIGQLGYAFDSIAKVEMPRPPQLQAATDLLSLGQPEQAIPLLDPVLNFYGPMKGVPGNWWVPAALLKTTALQALHREAEAEPLLRDLSQLATDPEGARIAKVRLAAIAARRDKGAAAQAQATYNSVINDSADSRVLAETWVDKGEGLLETKQYESALVALLHVPVFYQEQRLLMPRALLGSARAFKGMEDFARARDQLNRLTNDYGGSAESAAAKDEMKAIDALEQKKKKA